MDILSISFNYKEGLFWNIKKNYSKLHSMMPPRCLIIFIKNWKCCSVLRIVLNLCSIQHREHRLIRYKSTYQLVMDSHVIFTIIGNLLNKKSFSTLHHVGEAMILQILYVIYVNFATLTIFVFCLPCWNNLLKRKHTKDQLATLKRWTNFNW